MQNCEVAFCSEVQVKEAELPQDVQALCRRGHSNLQFPVEAARPPES